MDTLKKFLEWLKPFPTWIKCIILILIAGLILIVSMSFTSCGTPRTVATVQNVNPNSTVTVTLSVSNSTVTDVNTEPSINVDTLKHHGTNSY